MEFKKYVKINKITKSVKFEMIPVGRTRETLEKDGTIEMDAERKKNAITAKEVSDAFYRDFLDAFSKKADYDWENLGELFLTRRADTESRKKYEEAVAARKDLIAKDAAAYLDSYIQEFLKERGISTPKVTAQSSAYVDILLPAYAQSVEKYDNDEMKKVMESLQRTATSTFKGYFIAYEHIVNGTGFGSIAYRIMENFEIMCYNMELYKRAYEVLQMDDQNVFTDMGYANRAFSQQGINRYNEEISGLMDKDGRLIKKGVNMAISEHNNEAPDKKLPYFGKLKKQILTSVTPMFTFDKIEDVAELREILEGVLQIDEQAVGKIKTFFTTLGNAQYNLSQVYLSQKGKNAVSNRITGDWNYINAIWKDVLIENILSSKNTKKKTLTKKEMKQIEDTLKGKGSTLSITDCNEFLKSGYPEQKVEKCLLEDVESVLAKKEAAKTELRGCTFWTEEKRPAVDENIRIQAYIDEMVELKRLFQMFETEDKETADVAFMLDLEEIQNILNPITSYYRMIRSYITRKIGDEKERVQLCFGRAAHYEQKWANKQEGKFGNLDAALLEYDGRYYYIVPSPNNSQKLNFPVTDSSVGESYAYLHTQKCVKLSMALPKFTFKSKEAIARYSKEDREFNIPVGSGEMTVSRKMFDDYNNKTYKDNADDRIALINYAKEFLQLNESFNIYDYSSLRPAEEYRTYGEFCDAVDAITYKVKKKFVKKDLVDAAVERGDLYMFCISSAQMYKQGTTDVYIKRFRAIMNAMETGSSSIIINNGPNIYYRKALIQPVDKHPIGSMLVNKFTSDGRRIPGDIYLELCAFYNKKREKLSPAAAAYNEYVVVKESDRPHIKDKCYSQEKFIIQLSYTINKAVPGETMVSELNRKIRRDIMENGCNIMSIIRGNDNLLYYIVVDQSGNKIDSGSLNKIGGKDYYDMLASLGRERKTALNWTHGRKIAELKDSYLGEVCRKIASIAISNNAIICIDKLRDGFKDKMQAFDAQVYKKFEAKLENVLADYYDKEIPDEEAGGVLNPLQLAVPGGQAAYQNGIIFYIYASFTKNVCMETGFVNLLDTYNISTISAKMRFLARMDRIWYNADKDEFEFDFAWSRLGCILKEEEQALYDGMDTEWKISTRLPRYRRKSGQSNYEEVNGTELLKDYIRNNQPKLIGGGNIDPSTLDGKGVSLLFEMFTLYANGYVARMGGEESSYYSPVCSWSNIGKLPYDEMTARRLAEKGQMTINNMNEDKLYYVTKTDWLNYLLSGEMLNKTNE